MATAYKCDRCGGFYVRNDIEPVHKEIGYELNVTKTELHMNVRHLDLCPSCIKELNNFLNEKKSDN